MEEKDLKEINQAVGELRTLVESKNADAAEVKEKIEKLNKFLDEQEIKNQELVQKMAVEEKAKKELEEKISKLETALARPNLTKGDKNEKSAEVKAFDKLITKGKDYLEPEERKYLRTDSNVEGGFLAPDEYVADILKKITEISPIRKLARIRNTSSKALEIPTRETILTAYWPGEGQTASNSNSTYGENRIPVNRLTAVVPVTVEMLSDAAFNVESEVNMDMAEAFAQAEGAAFVNGSGVERPKGFLYDANITTRNSGLANSYTADSVILLASDLKTGYNPMYGLNRTELAFLRTLKDGSGQYLWVSGIAQGYPNTINGYPYVELPDMENRTTNTRPIVFADFFRGYTIADGVGITMIRDAFSLSNQGQVRFVGYKRVGGQVTLGEAIAVLVCHL